MLISWKLRSNKNSECQLVSAFLHFFDIQSWYHVAAGDIYKCMCVCASEHSFKFSPPAPRASQPPAAASRNREPQIPLLPRWRERKRHFSKIKRVLFRTRMREGSRGWENVDLKCDPRVSSELCRTNNWGNAKAPVGNYWRLNGPICARILLNDNGQLSFFYSLYSWIEGQFLFFWGLRMVIIVK